MADASTHLPLRQRPLHTWLWKLAFALAVLFTTVMVANQFLPKDRAMSRAMFGHDFLAFYSAGTLVREDRAEDLYNLAALGALQQSIASDAGLEMNAALAPWWNPPHVALVFEPLSTLSFGRALAVWTVLGVGCLAAASALLIRIIRSESTKPSHWLLVPMFIAIAPPTIQALGHGQNTPLSLLLLTLTVLAWRAREPIWAGLACSLLAYKPQLAAIVFLALAFTLGWRVWVGAIVGGVPQLLATVTKLPGSLYDFIHNVPINLTTIQIDQSYPWHRHATLNGFFRFVLQGNAPGDTQFWISALSFTCVAMIGVSVAYIAWRRRLEWNDDVQLDRFISLVILSMPLLMPFYFDYDLLLLLLAGVLVARERLASEDRSLAARCLVGFGLLLFVWTMFNPTLAEVLKLNLSVPLLLIVFTLQAKRCLNEVTPDSGSIPLTGSTQHRAAA